MTAEKVISMSIELLGYGDSLGSTSDPRLQTTSINALNFVCADLFCRLKKADEFGGIITYSDEIELPCRVLIDVLPYGVAAFIAASLGDGEKQQYFASIYNLKRKSVVPEGSIDDVLPAPEF